jgi:hypothetical protein
VLLWFCCRSCSSCLRAYPPSNCSCWMPPTVPAETIHRSCGWAKGRKKGLVPVPVPGGCPIRAEQMFSSFSCLSPFAAAVRQPTVLSPLLELKFLKYRSLPLLLFEFHHPTSPTAHSLYCKPSPPPSFSATPKLSTGACILFAVDSITPLLFHQQLFLGSGLQVA